jgi:hypothetical protein
MADNNIHRYDRIEIDSSIIRRVKQVARAEEIKKYKVSFRNL